MALFICVVSGVAFVWYALKGDALSPMPYVAAITCAVSFATWVLNRGYRR